MAPAARAPNGVRPQREVDHNLRALLARKRRGLAVKRRGAADNASQLRDLQVQARAFEQQLAELEGQHLISQVRRRFGEHAAAAVQTASDAARQNKAAGLASEPSSFMPAAPAQPGAGQGPKKFDLGRDGTKMGLAAAAGGAMLLMVTAGSPIVLGVGLALGMGSAGAALLSKSDMDGAVSDEEIRRWRTHVHALSERLSRAQHLVSQLSSSSSGALAPPHGILSRPDSPTAADAAASSAGHGDAVAPGKGPAPQRASGDLEPPILAEAFRQVRLALNTEPGSWRLVDVHGTARVLEHCTGAASMPLCRRKGVVQVDASPRAVKNMVMEIREIRRQWDRTFEVGNLVDAISPNSQVVHLLFNPATSPFPSFASERDAVVWRHWVKLLPDAPTAADADTEVAQLGGGYLVVGASTLHAACPPVSGLLRAHVGVEAWHIKPIAYSVRSEVTHFCAVAPGGFLGRLARLSGGVEDAVARPFFERLAALAIYANSKHGCLAVPLPRDMAAEDASDDGHDGPGDAARNVRTYDPSTGLADDIRASVGIPYELATASLMGGVHGYSQPKAELFRVRSKGYLNDRIKVPSAPPCFDLITTYAFKMYAPVFHVAGQKDSPLAKLRAEGRAPPFTFVINLIIAGSPGLQGVLFAGMNEEEWSIHQQANAGGAQDRPATASDCFHRLLARFISPDMSPEANRFRDERLKLLPAVVQGPMLLRNSSGNRPAILGTKLRQRYFRGDDYFEVDVECCTSRAAAAVVNMVKGACRALVIDLSFLIQGNSEDELPERTLLAIRFSRVCIDNLIERPPDPPADFTAHHAQAQANDL